MTDYEPVVGMEIHVELKTKSKMFCGCKNDPFFAPKPNIYTCPVCLGMPGGLPVPNKKAIEWTIMLGLALGCEIPAHSKFDRKNYFYPDLAKGYQISQFDEPFCINGRVVIASAAKQSQNGIATSPLAPRNDIIRIHRVHLEEDTGKLQHETVDGSKVTLVDFNRSGVPLVEIVTEPDIRSGEQARAFLKKLHQIIRYIDISDADMEKGSMRLEPNISVRKVGETKLPKYKVEVKNINSFAFVKKAIDYEFERHIPFLEDGKMPPQENRGWNEDKGITVFQRSKEDAEDYRYFPEPDIPPLHITKDYVEKIRENLPVLPDEAKENLIKVSKLSEYQASILVDDLNKMSLFQGTASLPTISQANISGATVANWIINKVPDTSGVVPINLATQIIASQQVSDVDDSTIINAIQAVLSANSKAVADFKSGKEASKMFLFGNVLRELKGKGDKKKVMELLQKKLAE